MKTVKEVANNYTESLISAVKVLKNKPKLAVLYTIPDGPAESYRKSIHKFAEKIGVEVTDIHVTSDDINLDDYNGYIALNPFPTVHRMKLDHNKDIEGIHPENLKNLYYGIDIKNYPSTPMGIMMYLDAINYEFEGIVATVVGRSNTVGRPMFHMLERRGCTCIQAHSHTRNLQELTKKSDLIVTAAGVPNLICKSMCAPFSLVIDAGFNVVHGKICGDCNYMSFQNTLVDVTPVPGGIGLMTNVALFTNLINNISEHS